MQDKNTSPIDQLSCRVKSVDFPWICQFYMCYYIKRLIDLIQAKCSRKVLPVSPAIAKISIQSY